MESLWGHYKTFLPHHDQKDLYTHCSHVLVKAFRVHHVLKECDSKKQDVCWCSGVRRSCWSHLHVVQHLEEGEGHATADDHLVHLVQHVVDQLDLIFHLRPERHRHTSTVEIRVTRRRVGENGKEQDSSESDWSFLFMATVGSKIWAAKVKRLH